MAYSLMLKCSRNKGWHLKTKSCVEINDGRLDSKAKASANTMYEKYMAMAHKSMVAGDPIAAEDYYQHAEHYLRLMNESKSITLDADQADNGEDMQGELLPLTHKTLTIDPVELRTLNTAG